MLPATRNERPVCIVAKKTVTQTELVLTLLVRQRFASIVNVVTTTNRPYAVLTLKTTSLRLRKPRSLKKLKLNVLKSVERLLEIKESQKLSKLMILLN